MSTVRRERRTDVSLSSEALLKNFRHVTSKEVMTQIHSKIKHVSLVNLAWITIGKKLVMQLALGRKYREREEQEHGKSYFTFYTLLKHLNLVISIACLRINS